MLELARTDIDADRHVQIISLPQLDLGQRLGNDPFTHINRQRMILNGRQKLGRSKQALLGMLPANQRFSPNHDTAAHVDLGLVIKNELLVGQGQPDALNAFVLSAHAAIPGGIKIMVAVFARQLGLVHGLIGLTQQLIGLDFFGLRVKSDPQTDRHLQPLPLMTDRLASRHQQAVEHRHTGLAIAQIQQHRHKFVTPHARQRVTLTQHLLHAVGHRHQQGIAGIMTMAIIDDLETIQIEIDHRQLGTTALRTDHALL
ncbi:hypothetical protein GALL_548680 [mine drainage metagenome]|uniref:Uncharacterized protein n=1 Tax=mine drainage metagenome TaxID=410659 RepID=A0A1J5P723_9ZZZZ